MQISSCGAAQAMQVQRAEKPRQTRPSSGFGNVLQSELQKDQANISQAGRDAQAGVLSASEKTFFNDSFGMNVFGADGVSGPVVGKQAAKVLDSQEINYFQNTFGGSSKVTSFNRSSYNQASQAQGMALNTRA